MLAIEADGASYHSSATARDRYRLRLLPGGTPIDQYLIQTVVQLAGWIESDGVIRTVDEVVRAASAELGYTRLGPKIRARLEQAVDAHRNGRRLR